MDEALAEKPESGRKAGSPGMFERFTDRAKRVVVLAQEEARDLCHNYIGTEHLLLGLLQERESVAAVVLRSLGADHGRCLAEVVETIGRGQKRPTGHIPFTPRAKKSLEHSLGESLRLGLDDIRPEHLFLGVLVEGESTAVQVLLNLGVSVDLARQRVAAALAEKSESEQRTRTPDPSEGVGDRAGGVEHVRPAVPSSAAAPEAVVTPQRDITLSAAERDRLHEALAVVFPVRRVVERVLRGTDYPLARLPSFEGSSPLDAWDAIMLDLQHGIIRAGFHQLLASVVHMYPHHPVFRALAEEHGVVRTDIPTS
ncbi:Clp protease N-terminal domain-containing protein [Nocardiopsis deserti]